LWTAATESSGKSLLRTRLRRLRRLSGQKTAQQHDSAALGNAECSHHGRSSVYFTCLEL
jgi:hypothetical protein